MNKSQKTSDVNQLANTIVAQPSGDAPNVDPPARDGEDSVNARSQAFAIRAVWMRKMGFSEEEITEACTDDGSQINLQEEQEHLYYADKLQEITPPRSVLESWAVKS
jgi:hypothetical protein